MKKVVVTVRLNFGDQVKRGFVGRLVGGKGRNRPENVEFALELLVDFLSCKGVASAFALPKTFEVFTSLLAATVEKIFFSDVEPNRRWSNRCVANGPKGDLTSADDCVVRFCSLKIVPNGYHLMATDKKKVPRLKDENGLTAE